VNPRQLCSVEAAAEDRDVPRGNAPPDSKVCGSDVLLGKTSIKHVIELTGVSQNTAVQWYQYLRNMFLEDALHTDSYIDRARQPWADGPDTRVSDCEGQVLLRSPTP